jgi:hypothetical protein
MLSQTEHRSTAPQILELVFWERTNGVITGHHENQKFVRTPAMWKLWW